MGSIFLGKMIVDAPKKMMHIMVICPKNDAYMVTLQWFSVFGKMHCRCGSLGMVLGLLTGLCITTMILKNHPWRLGQFLGGVGGFHSVRFLWKLVPFSGSRTLFMKVIELCHMQVLRFLFLVSSPLISNLETLTYDFNHTDFLRVIATPAMAATFPCQVI